MMIILSKIEFAKQLRYEIETSCSQDTHFDAYKNTVFNSIRLFSGKSTVTNTL